MTRFAVRYRKAYWKLRDHGFVRTCESNGLTVLPQRYRFFFLFFCNEMSTKKYKNKPLQSWMKNSTNPTGPLLSREQALAQNAEHVNAAWYMKDLPPEARQNISSYLKLKQSRKQRGRSARKRRQIRSFKQGLKKSKKSSRRRGRRLFRRRWYNHDSRSDMEKLPEN